MTTELTAEQKAELAAKQLADANAAAAEAAKKAAVTPEVQALIDAQVDEQLKKLKGNLDAAYAARDEALKKVSDAEAAGRQAEIKRLESEGKTVEALQAQLKEQERLLAEERTRTEAERTRNTELARDGAVRAALAGTEFRNTRAADMAFKEVVATLTRGDNGEWRTKDGATVTEATAKFLGAEENSFLLKTRPSSGSGINNAGTQTSTKPQSLFDLPQAEVLKRAAEGKLRKR